MTTSAPSNGWWSRRWLALLKQLGFGIGDDGASLRGSRVKRMEVAPGLIQAQVQDREAGTAAVEIRIAVIDDAHWERVFDALGSQAIYAAQLLAGNMPPEIESIFIQAGASLLPESAGEITHTCSACPPGSKLCRPLAAVYWQLGEMLAEDPWLLLRLRGRDRQQVLAAIHERRNTGAEASPRPATPAVAAESEMTNFYMPMAPSASDAEEELSLEDQINDFWGRRKVLEEIHYYLARPKVELALLRRLGAPTPTPDGQDAYCQLQEVYRKVTDRVWNLAFAADDDHPEENGERA